MERRKRKKPVGHEEARKSVKLAVEPECQWSKLPVEIMSMILEGNKSCEHFMTIVVCRFVCKLWRDLLPSVPPKAETAKFDFSAKAAEGGHFYLLVWAKKNGCPFTKAAFSGAASFGNLELLQWMKESGCPSDLKTCAKLPSTDICWPWSGSRRMDYPGTTVMYAYPLFGGPC